MESKKIRVGDSLRLIGSGWTKGDGHVTLVKDTKPGIIITGPCGLSEHDTVWRLSEIEPRIQKGTIVLIKKRTKFHELVERLQKENNDEHKTIYIRT